MLKNGLIGFILLLAGLVMIVGKFHLYIMIAGGALILISCVFIRRFKQEMTRKTFELLEKKRLEKMRTSK